MCIESGEIFPSIHSHQQSHFLHSPFHQSVNQFKRSPIRKLVEQCRFGKVLSSKQIENRLASEQGESHKRHSDTRTANANPSAPTPTQTQRLCKKLSVSQLPHRQNQTYIVLWRYSIRWISRRFPLKTLQWRFIFLSSIIIKYFLWRMSLRIRKTN